MLAPLMRRRHLYRLIWPRIQRSLRVVEAVLPIALQDWHHYEICWGERSSSFLVDGQAVLADAPSPHGPLCFVVWIDNQYLVATPQGTLGWGLLDAPAFQWLQIRDLHIR
ncbi:MAG: hypothetical protein HC822_18325 [Oscillochloris sp.]|nr:hypothetical protein [Oscillochloris sp.]